MSEQTTEQQTQGLNPAWKPLLDGIPDSMHGLIIPHLQQWDKQVQDKLQETSSKYEPYKGLVENNISPDILNKALTLFDAMAKNPQEVIEQAIEAYKLPYVDANAIDNNGSDEDEDEYESYGSDISNHPMVKQMAQQLEQLQGTVTSVQQQEANAQALKEHEQWLDDQAKTHGEFDRMYVTALMSQGVDGNKAIEAYQKLVADAAGQSVEQQTQQTQEQPPVVLGNSGTSGSGLPDGALNIGSMKDGEVSDLVVKMLQAQADQNNQG